MNTLYGILSNQYYKLLYDKTAGDDCTRIGREWIKYSRKEFSEAGYEILYTDTDSIFVRDPFNDKQRLEKKEKEIIDFIKSTVPFPQDTFEFGTECEINYMYFFKGGNEDKETDDEMDELDFINKGKGYMKKNYIYVDTKGKVVIKNLGLRKKSNSELSKKIFWDYLVPEIKQGKIKFSRQMIKNLIIKLLKENITLIAMRKDVNVFERYEKSETSMPAQISKKYGEGVHYMIPNLKCIGVGKGKSLCTIEEFKTYELTIDDIDLSNIWSELSYFIEPVKVKTLFSFGEENVA
jgi:DNA polymerase elongation subunit (family B)